MRILWVKAGKLLPVDTGGRIRSYNILRRLAEKHAVTLLSYYVGRRDTEYERELALRFPGAVTMATGVPEEGTLGPAWDYLRWLFTPVPYAIAKFTARPVAQLIERWLGERRFDIAVCDFIAPTLNFPSRLATPTVLFAHNIEAELWRRQAAWERNPVRKLVFKLEAAKMALYEPAAAARFHHVLAVSEPDREAMARAVDPGRITVIPTGVDLSEFRCEAGDTEPAQPLVVFTGSMDWEANIDAVEFFCRDVWPAVRATVPEARFRIVGRNPHARVRALASDSIDVTGAVASVAEHLKPAAVAVVPLRIGGGTRLKIYEAMAMGKAVVSTRVGAEGLDVHPGTDIWFADDPRAFSDAVATLLRDSNRRRQMGEAAHALAVRYDWPTIADRFAEVLEEVARSAGGSGQKAGLGLAPAAPAH
jgi:glycosyltransferase involved in cell wall biosynthesis